MGNHKATEKFNEGRLARDFMIVKYMLYIILDYNDNRHLSINHSKYVVVVGGDSIPILEESNVPFHKPQ